MRDFFRLAFRVRYWRKRALRAERQIVENSIRAEAEMYRNREREDTFVSAAILGGRGMVGIAPRTGPAGTPERHPLIAHADPWQALTRLERDEFETEYLIGAMRNNISPQRAKSDFLAELARRKAFNDEPSM